MRGLMLAALTALARFSCSSANIADCKGLQNIKSHSSVALGAQLNCSESLNISNLINVTINGPVNITCTKDVGIIFINVTNLTLEDITVTQCGLAGERINEMIASADYQFLYAKVAVLVFQSYNVSFHNLSIINTEGIGLVCINVLGTVNFVNANFHNNRPHCSVSECERCIRSFSMFNITPECLHVGGSLLFVYTDLEADSNGVELYHIAINRSDFDDNYSCSLANIAKLQTTFLPSTHQALQYISATAGIKIICMQKNYLVNAKIVSSTFKNNTDLVGSAISVEAFVNVAAITVSITDSIFSDNGKFNNITSFGGSISFTTAILPLPNQLLSHSLSIANCNFTNNIATLGGAIYLKNAYNSEIGSNLYLQIFIKNCTFIRNTAVYGNSMYVDSSLVMIIHSRFYKNSAFNVYGGNSFESSFGALYCNKVKVFITDSMFKDNTGSVVNLISSILTKAIVSST